MVNDLVKVNINGVSPRYKVWIRQADYDIQASKGSLETKFYEWSCFQAEQCVEKALKAYLVFKGFRPPKIHRISILVSLCNRADPNFKNTKFDFHELESYTFISRYPFLIPGENTSPHEYITFEDAELCLKEASQFLDKIKNLLNA